MHFRTNVRIIVDSMTIIIASRMRIAACWLEKTKQKLQIIYDYY